MKRAVIIALIVPGSLAATAWPQEEREAIPAWQPPENGWLVLEDFSGMALGDKPMAWQAHGTSEEAKARLAVVDTGDTGREGRALALRGPLTQDTDREIVEAARWLPVPMIADGLALTIRGDSKGHHLFLRIEDSSDETFQYRLGAVQSEEWERRTVIFDQTAVEVSWGGRRDGTLDYPLRLKSIGVTTTETGEREGDFEVLVTDLAAGLGETAPLVVHAQTYETVQDAQPWRLVPDLGHVAVSIALTEADEVIFPVVSYDWGGEGAVRPNSYIEVLHCLPLQTGQGTAFAWIRGDASRPFIQLRVQDGREQMWQIFAFHTSVMWRGWRCVFWDVWPEDSMRQGFDSWGGDEDDKMQPPLTFHSLVIDDCGAVNYIESILPSAQVGQIGLGPIYYVPWEEG